MKLSKKLYGLDIEVAPIPPRGKRQLERLIVEAKHEISEWRRFLRVLEKKLGI